ncbi:signal peptidase I [Paenibacillus sp. GCM10027629]|uniref:signal peptidase I n=1 Tax=Paenibacillus sp. GCM10027629 TaxID=3273414 RepID=UPI0036276544
MANQTDSHETEPNESQEQPGKNKLKNEAVEWAKAIAIAVVLVVIIRWFVFAPFMVDGPSMQPNFHTGERVIVNKFLYDFRAPKPGEVVVFHVPQENRDYIKRVVAVAGDTVKVQGDDVYVNGKKISEPYIQGVLDEYHSKGEQYNNLRDFPNADVTEEKVPEGHIFAMGDNRRNSTDSRMIGYIDLKEVVGRAEVVFWPYKDITIVNH